MNLDSLKSAICKSSTEHSPYINTPLYAKLSLFQMFPFYLSPLNSYNRVTLWCQPDFDIIFISLKSAVACFSAFFNLASGDRSRYCLCCLTALTLSKNLQRISRALKDLFGNIKTGSWNELKSMGLHLTLPKSLLAVSPLHTFSKQHR